MLVISSPSSVLNIADIKRLSLAQTKKRLKTKRNAALQIKFLF